MQQEVAFWKGFFKSVHESVWEEDLKSKKIEQEENDNPAAAFRSICKRNGIILETTPFQQVVSTLRASKDSHLCGEAFREWDIYNNELWKRTAEWRANNMTNAGPDALQRVVNKLTLAHCFMHPLWTNGGKLHTAGFPVLHPDFIHRKKRSRSVEIDTELAQQEIKAIDEYVSSQSVLAMMRVRAHEQGSALEEHEKKLVDFKDRVQGDLVTLALEDGVQMVLFDWQKKYEDGMKNEEKEWISCINDYQDDGREELLTRLQKAKVGFTASITKAQERIIQIAKHEAGKKAFVGYHVFCFMRDWSATYQNMVEQWVVLSTGLIAKDATEKWKQEAELFKHQTETYQEKSATNLEEMRAWQTERWDCALQYDVAYHNLATFEAAEQILSNTSKISTKQWKKELLKLGRVNMAARTVQKEWTKDEQTRLTGCTQLANKQKIAFQARFQKLIEEANALLKLNAAPQQVSVSISMTDAVAKPSFLAKNTGSHITQAQRDKIHLHLSDMVQRGLSLTTDLLFENSSRQWFMQQPLRVVRSLVYQEQHQRADASELWSLLPFVMQLKAILLVSEPKNF